MNLPLNRNTILVFFFLACCSLSFAQEKLHVMLSKGTLPEWVNTPQTKQLAVAKTEKKAQGYKLNRAMSQMLDAATELQYDYLQSGRLLFNDEAGVMASAIAQKLLKGDFSLRHSLKICVAYTNSNNITACANGFMIIDLGLFAQLENEDQLAFLISHELAHMRNGDMTISEQPMHFETVTPELHEYINFRRERERLADSIAYKMYIEAGYAPEQVFRAFDVLSRNWMVPTGLPFNTSLFTDAQFRYSDSLLLSIDSCSPGINDSEYYSTTQVEFSARKEQLKALFDLKGHTSSAKAPSAQFTEVNKLAIYNCGLYALQSGETAMALYAGFYLHSIDSACRDEAGLLIAKALYVNAALSCPEVEDNATVVIQKSEYEQYFSVFEEVSNEEKIHDERGYVAGVNIFLDRLSPMEDAALSVRWSWPYYQRAIHHRALAEEIAGYSVAMLNARRSLPFDSIGHIHTMTLVRKKLEVAAEDEKTEAEINREKKQEAELRAMRERAKYDPEKLQRIDSAIAALKEKRQSNGYYYQKQIAGTSTQLLSLTADSSFRIFYTRHADPQTFSSLIFKPHPPLSKGDSIYLLSADFYWFDQLPLKNELNMNYKKTSGLTNSNRAGILSAAKSKGLHVVTLGNSTRDSVSTTLYNGYCLASRIREESSGYGYQSYAYPIVFKEEFDAVTAATGVKYAMTDFGVLRNFNNNWTLDYRKTKAVNLVSGNTDWIAVSMGKGKIAGGEHLGRFFSAAMSKK